MAIPPEAIADALTLLILIFGAFVFAPAGKG